MGRRKRHFFKDSAYKDGYLVQYYIDRLTGIALSLYEWKNLPDTVDARFLETTLFMQGQAAFFKDEVVGYLALPFAVQGQLSLYRLPTTVRAYAINGYQKTLTPDERVLIFNSNTLSASNSQVQMFAYRLSDLDSAIDVNARAQKTPVLIKCAESERLTMLNAYKEYDGNSPVIAAERDALSPESFTVFKTDAPYVADKLYDLKSNIWNEALTYLGVPNVQVQKKERMITDEVVRAQGGTIASRFPKLDMRKKAAEQINKKFGLDIEVDFREAFNVDGKGGADDGDLYDRSQDDFREPLRGD